MTSIAETSSASGPNAARSVNLRAFLAGGAATSALIAGAVVVFISLAAYVAFDGLVGGAEGSSDATVQVPATGAPEAAAAAAGGAPAAVAAAPAAPTAAALPTAPAAPAIPPTAAAPETGPVEVVPPSTTTETSTADPVGVVPPATTPEQPGALGNTVQNLDDTAAALGLDLPLNDATSGLTGTLDQTIKGTLNGVGGLVGNSNLGNQVNTTLNNVTDGLLGGGR